MMEIEQQIKASVANGLSKSEIEALIGRSLTDEEQQLMLKTKALVKLKKMKEKNDKQHEEQPTTDLQKLSEIYKKPPALPPVSKRYTKEQVMDEIEANYGIITLLCAKLDCTARQLYKAIDEWELRGFLKECKGKLVGLAETAILECLASKNEGIKLKAAETTLKSLGRDQGWDSSPQVQIAQQINVTNDETKIKEIFGL